MKRHNILPTGTSLLIWVLLNSAPTSTQLHLPPPNSFQPPPSSFQPSPSSL